LYVCVCVCEATHLSILGVNQLVEHAAEPLLALHQLQLVCVERAAPERVLPAARLVGLVGRRLLGNRRLALDAASAVRDGVAMHRRGLAVAVIMAVVMPRLL
jgi:hypothetical protein